jgi:hypothetical protein
MLLTLLLCSTASAAVPPPNPKALLEGSWVGTESCAEHCCGEVDGKNHCQGVVPATLSFGAGGNGTYSIDGLVIASEFRANFAAGHVQSTLTAAPHGSFIVQANATNLYGSWISFGSQRIFHWDFTRAVPPLPPPPPCSIAKTAAACGEEIGCMWTGAGACRSQIKQQVDVFVGGTKAPWGTVYACFRVRFEVYFRAILPS